MIHEENNSFAVLMDKKIYSILDGDTELGEYTFADDYTKSTISMPYLRCSDLRALCVMYDVPIEEDISSRWQYFESLFAYCIKENRCSELLTYLFDKKQFSKKLEGHNVEAIEAAYNSYIETIISKINGVLYFKGKKLVFNGNQFSIQSISEKVEIKAPAIKNVDREYIRNISIRAMDDIDKKNYDSALTKSRTLLEEAFCYVIEKGNETPSASGNIRDLYKQVKDIYNMHTDANTDTRIKTLLSGLEKIVSSISEMRNKDGDAHGVGASRISIDEHHARLFVNAAIAMADFILSVEKKAHSK